MKKLFILFLVIPLFLASSSIISTEQELAEAAKSLQYGMTKTTINDLSYYQTVPEKPISLDGMVIYKDQELKTPVKIIAKNTSLSLKQLLINEQRYPIFELTDGNYTLASKHYIANDKIINKTTHQADYWLKDGFNIYKEPYRVGVTTVKSKLTSYNKVKVKELATTIHGKYLHIENHGWVAENDLSSSDNRLEKVSLLLKSKYNKTNLAVSIQQLSTGLTAGINQNKSMYSASVTKLPLLYYVQYQINQGKLTPTDRFKYIEEVNDFEGAYDPSGTGDISKTADNKEYTVEELIKAVAQSSDNVATNILAYYVADKYGTDYQHVISKIVDWDSVSREVTPDVALKMMAAIYEQNGHIIDYLSSTKFDDQRISKYIDTKVAHKTGDAYDFRHDVAIVYGDNPFILSIFTENMTYDDISDISKEIYTILK